MFWQKRIILIIVLTLMFSIVVNRSDYIWFLKCNINGKSKAVSSNIDVLIKTQFMFVLLRNMFYQNLINKILSFRRTETFDQSIKSRSKETDQKLRTWRVWLLFCYWIIFEKNIVSYSFDAFHRNRHEFFSLTFLIRCIYDSDFTFITLNFVVENWFCELFFNHLLIRIFKIILHHLLKFEKSRTFTKILNQIDKLKKKIMKVEFVFCVSIDVDKIECNRRISRVFS